MRGIKSVALLCTLALGAPAFSAGLTKTLPGDLTTAQAQAVVQASMKKAREIKVPMNIAVMDAGGNLKAFARMDDAFIGSIDIAQKRRKRRVISICPPAIWARLRSRAASFTALR